MKFGETMVKIEARCKRNKTPFHIDKGKTYRFSASGTWNDAWIETTASGFSSIMLWLVEWLRREPKAKWFSVIGRIDNREDTQFDIGKLLEDDEPYTATASGTLDCFANDVSFMYFNNSGAIDLSVEETSTESQDSAT